MTPKSKIIKSDKIDQDVSISSRLDMIETSNASLASDKKIISPEDLDSIKKGKKIIEDAKAKAKIIKEAAKEIYLQIEQKMEESKQQGFEQGRQEGLASVTELLTKIQNQNQDMLDNIEKEAISLVYEIAQKVIGEELKSSDKALLGMIRHALQSSMGNELTLFVHPKDYERIKAKETQLMSVLQAVQTMYIKSSENVKESGCVIESELGTIDAQLEYQLEAIRKALGVDSEKKEESASAEATARQGNDDK